MKKELGDQLTDRLSWSQKRNHAQTLNLVIFRGGAFRKSHGKQ